MPTLTQTLICKHPKCSNTEIISHNGHYAGWTVVQITQYGFDGLTLNTRQSELHYCPDHREYLSKALRLETYENNPTA